MNFPWIDLTTPFFSAIRIIVGIGGFFVGYLLSTPFWRVGYWLRYRRSINTTGLLFWLKLLSGITLAMLLYFFLPLGGLGLGGGGTGTGAGKGNGTGPGIDNQPGKGVVGPTTQKGATTSQRKVVTIELLGGERYKHDGRYYLIDRKEPAVDKEAVEELLKRDPSKLEIQLFFTAQSVHDRHPAAEAVRSLARQHQVPILETVSAKQMTGRSARHLHLIRGNSFLMLGEATLEVRTVNAYSTRLIQRCDESLEDHVALLAEAGPAAIDERLDQIQEEWSVGRAAKVTAGVLALGAAAAEVLGQRRMSVLLALAAGSCLCPYVLSRRSVTGDLLCHLGFRQGTEIERERIALKALRGDFQHVPTLHDVESHDDIARLEGEGGIAGIPRRAQDRSS